MNLYITRNGERLGPYSREDVQGFLAAGSLQINDWAWYEGLAGWIPLHQVPGFAAAPSPLSARRPILVWIISLFYFACSAFYLLGLAMVPFVQSVLLSPSGHLLEAQRVYLESLNWFDYSIGLIETALSLAAAIFLFRLRRPALYFFAAVFSLRLFYLMYSIAAKNYLAVVGMQGLATLPIALILQIALLAYVVHLYQKDILR